MPRGQRGRQGVPKGTRRECRGSHGVKGDVGGSQGQGSGRQGGHSPVRVLTFVLSLEFQDETFNYEKFEFVLLIKILTRDSICNSCDVFSKRKIQFTAKETAH